MEKLEYPALLFTEVTGVMVEGQPNKVLVNWRGGTWFLHLTLLPQPFPAASCARAEKPVRKAESLRQPLLQGTEYSLRSVWVCGVGGRDEGSPEPRIVLRKGREWRRDRKDEEEELETSHVHAQLFQQGKESTLAHRFSWFFRVRYVWNFIFFQVPWLSLLNDGCSELISCGEEKAA